MAGVRLDLSEVHALARDINHHAEQTPARARAVVAAGGFRTVAAIQAEIRRLDLIDTANMVNGTSVDVDGLAFEAGPVAEYAIYQDQGTSELPANNFTGRGFDQVYPSIEAALTDLGASVLDRA